MQDKNKWRLFIGELSNLIFFWFFGILFFLIYRITFLTIFFKHISCKTKVSEVIHAVFTGLRYDSMTVGIFMAFPLFFLLILPHKPSVAERVRKVMQYVFVLLSTTVCMLAVNYYAQYDDLFNSFFFLGLMYDDQVAIAKTIWKDCYPILNILGATVTVVGSVWILRYYENRTRIASFLLSLTSGRKVARVLLLVLFFVMYFITLRGSIGVKTLRTKNAFVTTDAFLNKMIMNPIKSLNKAYKEFKVFDSTKENPYGSLNHKESENLDELLKKEVDKLEVMGHDQIFVVIMESYDSWPLMEKYRGLGLSRNLSKYADEGTHFTNFLPSFNGTCYALSTITSGIPHAGTDLSIAAMTQQAYKTSIFDQFEKLGFKSQFFYGGYGSWHNSSNYIRHIGCDSIYNASDAEDLSTYGEWGVEDEELFKIVLNNVDSCEKSINVILTTSYHTPFDVDVYAKGFPYHTFEDIPEEYRKYCDGSMSVLAMGHLWYSDLAIGKFMEVAKKKYPNALFVFTGDHYGRRFLNAHPTAAEHSFVPLILYGKGIPAQRLDTPGSHMDILPTLIELEAPHRDVYYGVGESMLNPSKNYGIGFGKVVTKKNLYILDSSETVRRFNLETQEMDDVKEFPKDARYKDILRLAWQYGVKGRLLEKEDDIIIK